MLQILLVVELNRRLVATRMGFGFNDSRNDNLPLHQPYYGIKKMKGRVSKEFGTRSNSRHWVLAFLSSRLTPPHCLLFLFLVASCCSAAASVPWQQQHPPTSRHSSSTSDIQLQEQLPPTTYGPSGQIYGIDRARTSMQSDEQQQEQSNILFAGFWTKEKQDTRTSPTTSQKRDNDNDQHTVYSILVLPLHPPSPYLPQNYTTRCKATQNVDSIRKNMVAKATASSTGSTSNLSPWITQLSSSTWFCTVGDTSANQQLFRRSIQLLGEDCYRQGMLSAVSPAFLAKLWADRCQEATQSLQKGPILACQTFFLSPTEIWKVDGPTGNFYLVRATSVCMAAPSISNKMERQFRDILDRFSESNEIDNASILESVNELVKDTFLAKQPQSSKDTSETQYRILHLAISKTGTRIVGEQIVER